MKREHSPDIPAEEAERILVARLRDGDPDAFAALIAQYANRLMRFAYHIVGSRDAAEDIVQQVFVQVWERRASFRPDYLKPYLFGAVRNHALKERSAAHVRDRYKANTQDEAIFGSTASETLSPEGHILASTVVQSAIERLPERRRLAARLRLEEEMTHAEIAEVLGISVAAAKRLVARSIVELRRTLWGKL